jgi:hypothetical protein
MTAPPPALRRSGALGLLALAVSLVAEATITPPANSFAPVEDVELGRDAAAVLRRQLPILTDGHVDRYVEALGRRLVQTIPEKIRQPNFEYRFIVLNVPELTSVGLPGGPVFISRAFIELAETEDGLAGLIAHELSHVVLRHATAQATASERYQIGAITGRAIGIVVAGRGRGIIERGADFAISTYFLTYDPEYEREADLLAAHMMAKAERAEPLSDTLPSIQARLAGIAAEPSRPSSSHSRDVPIGTVGYGVAPPWGGFHTINAGDLVQLRVPEDWRRLQAGNTVVFAPDGAFVDAANGPTAITHGLQVGVARSVTGRLEGDLEALLTSFGRGNAFLQWRPTYQRITIGGRSGLSTSVRNVSSTTGEMEYVSVSAAHLPDGSFLYVVGVAPQEEAGLYRNLFNRVLDSFEILK